MDRRSFLFAAGAFGLAGCGPRSEPPLSPGRAEPVGLTGTAAGRAALTDLYRQALAAGESEVVVFSTTGPSEWEPLWRGFAEAFPGLGVTYSHVSPNQVMTRINSEIATGRSFGDVFVVPVTIGPEIASKGYFQAYVPPTIAGLDDDYVDPAGFLHYPLGKVFGLAYNTRLVRPEQLPARFQDVLAPKWRRTFSYIKPGSVNGTTDLAIAVLKAHGRVTDDQLRGLRQAGAFGGIEAGVTYVSQGRQKLQLWAYLPTVVRQRSLGAPVDMAFVPDFSTVVPFGVALSRNVVHPNAARLLKAWLFTPRAQEILAREVSMFATMPGAPTPLLYPATPAEQAALLSRPPTSELVAQMDAQLKDLKSIFSGPLTS